MKLYTGGNLRKLVIASVVIVGLLTSCSAVTTETSSSVVPTSSSPAPKVKPTVERAVEIPLEIEQYFWPVPEQDYWDFVLLIDNPNPLYAWFDEDFQVFAVAEDGTLLDSAYVWATFLPLRRSAVYGTFYDVGDTKISKLEVSELDSGTSVSTSLYCSFEVSDFSVTNGNGASDVQGILSSNCEEDYEYPQVVVLVQDEEGNPVNGNSAILSLVKANGKSQFDALLWNYSPNKNDNYLVIPELGIPIP